MAVSRRRADSLPRAALTAVGVAGGVLALAAVGTTVAISQIARSIIVPPRRIPELVRILAVDRPGETITLSRDADTEVSGRYSLWFDRERGHARVGRILELTDATVTRELVGVDRGRLRAGIRARIGGWWYLHPRDLEFDPPYESIVVPTELGDAPAWHIPPTHTSDRWVIQVHGRASRRQEGLRAVKVFREAGFHTLLISYRNDGDAPFSLDGRYTLGDTEWRDVESAMRVAIERGAREIVLMGWSMGGATVLQTITRSPLADAVRGVVLESPVIDWVSTLEEIARELGVPRLLRRSVFATIGAGWGRMLTGQHDPIDFARLDFVRRAHELSLPVLLLHSDDDGFVPSAGSRALARARPDIVTFVPFRTARHTKMWNHDEDRWESAIARWLVSMGLVEEPVHTAQRA